MAQETKKPEEQKKGRNEETAPSAVLSHQRPHLRSDGEAVMKCNHIRTRAQGDTPFFPNMLNNANVEVCLKEDVDAAIAELKAALKKSNMDFDEMAYRIDLARVKCRAKAEEYKK